MLVGSSIVVVLAGKHASHARHGGQKERRGRREREGLFKRPIFSTEPSSGGVVFSAV